MDIEALARKVAEYANTCCYRSDGFEEDVLKVAREAIAESLLSAGKNVTHAAKQLRISRMTLYRLMAKHRLSA